MAKPLEVGDVFPVLSWKELEAAGLKFWEQLITIPELGTFIMDPEQQFRDGKNRWDSEDRKIRITTKVGTNIITEIRHR